MSNEFVSPIGTYPYDIYSHYGTDEVSRGLHGRTHTKNIIALRGKEKVVDCLVCPRKNKITIITPSLAFTFSRDGSEELNPRRINWWINSGHEMFGTLNQDIAQHTRCSVVAAPRGPRNYRKLHFQDDAYYRITQPLESRTETPSNVRPKNIIVSLPDDVVLRKEIYLSIDDQVLFLRDEMMNTWMIHRSDVSYESAERKGHRIPKLVPFGPDLQVVWVFIGPEREIPDHAYLLATSEEHARASPAASHLPVMIRGDTPLPATIMDKLCTPPSVRLLSDTLDSRCWVVSDAKGGDLLRLAIYSNSNPIVSCIDSSRPGILPAEGVRVRSEYYIRDEIPHVRHVVSPVITDHGIFELVLESETDQPSNTYSHSWKLLCNIC